jgi:thiamine biosynthesis protein ThiC
MNPELRIEKVEVAVNYGIGTFMDLSTGRDQEEIRRALIEALE